MPKLDVFDQKGNKISDLDIAGRIFEAPIRKPLLWESVKMHLANCRKGNASTKTRGQVSGSTRKIYRQKGTGNARHGDIKAPVFVGGGRVFGPHPRDYSYRMSRSARKTALQSVLSYKFKEGQLKIIDEISLSSIKTKDILKIFKSLNVVNALLLIEAKNFIIEKSVKNLSKFKVLRVDGVNPYDILKYEHLVLTQEALKKIEERV